ncbi:hypothetical protein CYFUS_001690 [Cystobacter fuscus]|uniref:Molybdate metabolism regulator n=1 Tax=Cystobacter fuscus TaxID=43 RepID=A0A250IZD7_9BACT|nr:TIGR02996 domain-containing protein [Cystobacter fuscus]ATB36276.1 hypothetical protein CYFUS_001690 [Cystobacter fuscus]
MLKQSLTQAAANGDWRTVLAQLLDAWRAAPHRELADRIAAVGAKLGAGTWDTVATKPDPTVLSALLDTLLDKGSVKARARLEAMEAWPEDPRIDRWVADRYADPPFTSTGARPFWTRLLPLARRVRDARAAETLAKARTGFDRSILHEEFLGRHLDSLQFQLSAVTDAELSADLREALPGIDAALRSETEAAKPRRSADAEALLAQVLAKPEDDEARAVLADVLQEAGHPRGELIALQLEATRRTLTPAEAKRERQLIKSARKELLGPLDEVLKPDCAFSRGFLSRAALKQGNSGALASAIEKTAGHPLWATVEHLEGKGDSSITPHEVMRSLRSLAHSSVGIKRLARMPKLEALVDDSHSEDWLALAQTQEAFPRLRELDVQLFPRQARDFLLSPLVARLERLQVRLDLPGHDPSIAEAALQWLALVPRLNVPDLTFRMVRYSTKDWSSGYQFVRDASGQLSVRVFTTAMNEPHEALVQADVLRGLDEIVKLKPASLVVAHQLRTDVRTAVEARARELGATLET